MTVKRFIFNLTVLVIAVCLVHAVGYLNVSYHISRIARYVEETKCSYYVTAKTCFVSGVDTVCTFNMYGPYRSEEVANVMARGLMLEFAPKPPDEVLEVEIFTECEK